MKKIYTILLAGFLVVAMANTGKSQGFQLGVKVLANATSLNGLDNNISAMDLKGKLTFGIGAFAAIKVSKLGIQPEILYLRQGAKYTRYDATLGGDGEFNEKMTYLTIPVMIKFYIIKALHVEAGPYFGILLSAEEDLTGTFGLSSVVGVGGDNKDQFKSSDIGVAFGLGADVKRLNLSVRYLLGLTDVSDYAVTSSTDKIKNGIFQLGIGISIVKKD